MQRDNSIHIALSADGTVLAIRGSRTSQVMLIDPATGETLATLPTTGYDMAFNHDGTALAVATARGTVELWRVP